MLSRTPLDRQAADICKLTDPHPHLNELMPSKAREILNQLQGSLIKKFDAELFDENFDTGNWGNLNIRFVRPKNSKGKLPVIFYIHGGGFVLGNAHTHDKLIRELSNRTNSVVIFPEYSLSPEAIFPTAMEQCFDILQHLDNWSEKYQLDLSRLVVAGDSAGATLATVMCLLNKERMGQHSIDRQLLFYPTTEAKFNTTSYDEFADHYYLTKDAVKWFWDQYTPDEKIRTVPAVTPLNATTTELKDLPAALIINGQADVLREDGILYAEKLREADVPVSQVTFQGTIHDFVMLNALDQSDATRAAMDLAISWINSTN